MVKETEKKKEAKASFKTEKEGGGVAQ